MQSKPKQPSVFLLALLPLAFLLVSCSVTRTAEPSRIGLLPLDGYRYTGSEPGQDTLYSVIRDEASFTAHFAAGNGSVRRPVFAGQTVVALVIKTAPGTALHFNRAEVVGKAVNVYVQPCTGCSASQTVAATIPNVGHARTVRFFVNGESKANRKL